MKMTALPGNPVEDAIRCFETWSETRVTIHDIDNSLTPYLHFERSQHRHPLCQSVKKNAAYNQRCMQFEIASLRRELHHQHNGRYHQCHAGLIEWCYPIFDNAVLKWVFFAGPRLTSPISITHQEPLSSATSLVQKYQHHQPSVQTLAQCEHIMEGLRQVAARISLWHLKYRQLNEKHSRRPQERRQQIQHFIQHHYVQKIGIADLAQHLQLSEARAAHVCREECGDTFINMVHKVRLHHACSLLQNTDLNIQHVAETSGFNDASHFYKQFHKHIGMTPKAFRKQSC